MARNGENGRNGNAHYGSGGKAQCVVEPSHVGPNGTFTGGTAFAGNATSTKAGHPAHKPMGSAYEGVVRKRSRGV